MAMSSWTSVAKRIAIIGAGPSGMAAAKYLDTEGVFDNIKVFEQRSHVGGLWQYTAHCAGDGMFNVPQTDPHIGLERPAPELNGDGKNEDSSFISPVYERLETNIPKSLMGYSNAPWDGDLQLFPRHEEVRRYLEAYGAELVPKIRFRTQVNAINPLDDGSWLLEYKNLRTAEKHLEAFDAVVVATGHFSVPYIPDIDGLRNWHEQYPSSISHSKYYRAPDSFKGQKVIVVGSSASGLDIASQISPLCQKPLLLSQKSTSYLAAGFTDDFNIETVPQITRVDSNTRNVIFSDGRVEVGIDHILFCTGYLYSLPFLESLLPNPISTGARVEHTYKHLFYAPRPTLAFLTLNQKIIPFPLAEVQSAVLARVWSGRLTLPPESEMAAWEQSIIDERGAGGEFHTLKFPKDAEYINELYDWAASAAKRDGLENGGVGRLPKRWGAWEYWARENFPAIRKAFISRGEARKNIRSLNEIGFEFPAGANEGQTGPPEDSETAVMSENASL